MHTTCVDGNPHFGRTVCLGKCVFLEEDKGQGTSAHVEINVSCRCLHFLKFWFEEVTIGTMLSTAFNHVCMGSCTYLRAIIPGALTSTRLRSAVLDFTLKMLF